MQEVWIFFLNCLAFFAAAIIAIVSLYLLFDKIIPLVFKTHERDYEDAKNSERFSTLRSLTGPLLVRLKNNTQFSAQGVADILPGEHEGHEDFVVFITTAGKKKYAHFKAINLVEEDAKEAP
jgi:hypothetical protein